MSTWRNVMMSAAAMTLVTACADSDARPVRDPRSSSPEATAAAQSQGTAPPRIAVVPAGAMRFTVATSGNVARYRVREQLMKRALPNDAVGETRQVTGAITLDSTGTLIPGQSRFVVHTSALKSDSDRRDGYVRGRLLQTEEYPTVELVPIALRGLPARLPSPDATAGPTTFELIGNLTVRGVTRPTTWRVTARQTGGQVTGTASTKFTFAEFGITPPRVPIVLSVADTIGLEYDFTLTAPRPVVH